MTGAKWRKTKIGARWRKSSFSGAGADDNCVEVPETLNAVRDSKCGAVLPECDVPALVRFAKVAPSTLPAS
jgi:hypothetical protein